MLEKLAFPILITISSLLIALARTAVISLGTLDQCTTVFPSLIIPIFSSAPGMITQSSTTFLVEQKPIDGHFCDCLISFVMPAASGSCQLEFSIPQRNHTDACGASQMYVWQVTAMLDSACCWDDAPGFDNLFGTVMLNGSETIAEIVGSFVCQSPVSFRIGMRAGESTSCSFEQTSSEGFILRYGCSS